MANVLIVDDEKMICEEFQAIIQDEGHEVDFAVSGLEAIDKVSMNDYDIVFLDILLPRMEGRQIFEEIRKIKEVPVVFMSGYMPPHKEREALGLGALACLSKPLDLEEVKRLIQSTGQSTGELA